MKVGASGASVQGLQHVAARCQRHVAGASATARSRLCRDLRVHVAGLDFDSHHGVGASSPCDLSRDNVTKNTTPM